MRIVQDKTGKIKYTVNTTSTGQVVKDASGNLLGFIQNGKTLDSSGKIVSHSEDISSLFN